MVRIAGFHPVDPGSSPGMGIRSYGVRVSTQDFESCDLGSIPSMTFIIYW